MVNVIGHGRGKRISKFDEFNEHYVFVRIMFNYRVYFMRQNASTPGGKVSAPAEYAVTQGRSSAPRSVARAHCSPFAPITRRPHPSRTVRAMSL
jgi:hypothetical protein